MTKLKEYTRANDFDRIVGRLQTENVIYYGVGDSILDVGCGVGEYTPMYLKRFSRVVGLDPSIQNVAEAQKKNKEISYIVGSGEEFCLLEEFDTISLNNVLEHADDPNELLLNCQNHLSKNGRIIVQVPNKESIARRLGVEMRIISGLDHISEKEALFYGHKRVYSLEDLKNECINAHLNIIEEGGILYKPLPNDDLWKLYETKGENFVNALLSFGRNRPQECACVYCVCTP